MTEITKPVEKSLDDRIVYLKADIFDIQSQIGGLNALVNIKVDEINKLARQKKEKKNLKEK